MKRYKDNVLSGNYFCIDIETTCLKPTDKGAGILELYYMIVENGEKISERYQKFFHENYKNTQHIHQIKLEEIEGLPPFIECKDLKEELLALFKRAADPNDDLVFMAQYAPFEHTWFKHFLNVKEDWFDKVKTADTRDISKHLFPDESHSLINLAKKFNIEPPKGQHDFHRADQDVSAMWEVFNNLINLIKEEDLEEYDPKTYSFQFKWKDRDKKSLFDKIKSFFTKK